jgi:hypothetical protein
VALVFVHKSYLKCSETARIAPNNGNHTERKLLIPNNPGTATLICKQGVTGSIPVTSTNILMAFSRSSLLTYLNSQINLTLPATAVSDYGWPSLLCIVRAAEF